MDETISLHNEEANNASPVSSPRNGNRSSLEDTHPLEEFVAGDSFSVSLPRKEIRPFVDTIPPTLEDGVEIFDISAPSPSEERSSSMDDTMFLVDAPSAEGNWPTVESTISLVETDAMDLAEATILLEKRIPVDVLAASLPRDKAQSNQEDTASLWNKAVFGEVFSTINNRTSEKTGSALLSDTVTRGNTSVVSLRKASCRDDTWKATLHGVCWLSTDGEFHFTRRNGSSASLGEHNGVFWSCDPWGRLHIQDPDYTFKRLDEDGTAEEIGQCVCNDWRLGLCGIHARQDNDRFYLLEYDTGAISLTGTFPNISSWEVTPRGLCLQYGTEFHLRRKDGSLHKIGERFCDAWRAGFYGIFLVQGRKFWFISYTGKERFLGTFRHDEWNVSSDRLYLRYRDVLSVVAINVDEDNQSIIRRFLGYGKRQEIGTLNTEVWLPDPGGVLYREGEQFFRIDDPTRDEPLFNNWWHPSHHSVCEKEGDTINHHDLDEEEVETLTQDSSRV